MTANVGTKLGRYDIVSCLARGGIADLILARAGGVGGFERHVVIKRLRPEHAKERAIAESFVSGARLASSLQHNNIVQVHDVDEADGTPYVTMEYLHGEDVRTLLAALQVRHEQLPLEHVIAIVSAVATALQQAHDREVVHGAITPTNVIVTYDGNVKVTDFGVSAAAIRPVDTQSGSPDGKISYMSPEQCTGGRVDARSDVFSLGTLLHELVTVRRLFKGATTFLTMSAIVEGEIPRPSSQRKDLPAALDAIIMKALSRDPAQRFKTAQQLGDALEEVAVTKRKPVSGLTRYLAQLFGDRPEPWLIEGKAAARDIPVDFGDSAGLVLPPLAATESCTISPSVATVARSPIVRARSRALARTASAPSVAAVVLVPPRTPPAPPISATKPARAEHTMVVPPLPPPKLDDDAVPTPVVDPTVAVHTGRRRWIGGAILAVAACIAVGAIVVIPAFVRRPVAETPRAPQPPPVVDPALETKPYEQLTARDLERERLGAAAVAPAEPTANEPTPLAAPVEPTPVADEPSAPTADEPKPVAVEAKPIADKPKPPPVPVVDPPVVRTSRPARPIAARPHAKATKAAPKWDPDSLLPKK